MSFFQLLRYIRKTQILMVQQYQDMINQVCHLAYDFLLILFDSRQFYSTRTLMCHVEGRRTIRSTILSATSWK